MSQVEPLTTILQSAVPVVDLSGVTVMTREIPVPCRRRVRTSKISGTMTGTVKAGWKILDQIARYGLSRGTMGDGASKKSPGFLEYRRSQSQPAEIPFNPDTQ